MENVKYIQASLSDIPILVKMRMAFTDELTGTPSESDRELMRQHLEDYFRRELNRSYYSWIATVNGEAVAIAGMVVRTQPGNYKNLSGIWGYIMSVYTIPAQRKKGFSSALMELLLTSGREMGITAFELHATASGEPVYVNCGFVKHTEPTYRKYSSASPTQS